MERSELELVQSVQAGNLADFDPLYTALVDAIYKYLYRRTLNRSVAEDLTSITFIKAMESIRSFDPSKGNLRPWLYRIARNAFFDSVRAKRVTETIDDVWHLASDSSATSETERKLDLEQLKGALAKLSADQREIVLLRMWEGLSYKEIASVTGKTENNSKVIFSRAIKELRTSLPTLLLLLLFPSLV